MITLDGVIQSPGSPTEDPSGGFQWGGWVSPFDDEIYNDVVRKELEPADYILGRKTFEIWANYWPLHSPFWPGINKGMKYVFSNTLQPTDTLITGWQNSALVKSVDTIRKIKASAGLDLHVWGSSQIVQLLLQHDLVDELRLKIHPITLGYGKKLFADAAIPASFRLSEHVITSTGVFIGTYQRTGDVKTGIAGQ